MAYRFKRGQIRSKAVRRIGREQFARARGVLAAAPITAEGVHECRKVVKRLRALLRLVEPQIPRKRFRKVYRGIGEVGDLLAGARDSHVLEQTFDKLVFHFGREAEDALRPLQSAISAERQVQPKHLDPAAIALIQEKLGEEHRQFELLSLKARGFGAILPSLDDTYRRARRNFARVRKAQSDERLHELRKAVQWHWRQMALISEAWPEQFASHIAACRELAECLGDDHDLAVLIGEAQGLSSIAAAEMTAIERIARARQAQLRRQVFPLCERLLAERPNAFAKRIRTYWRAEHLQQTDEVKPQRVPAESAKVNGDLRAVAAPRIVSKSSGAKQSQPAG